MYISDKTIKNLEFTKLLNWLSSYAHSKLAKRLIKKIFPLSSIDLINYRNELINEFITLIKIEGKLSFYELKNIKNLLKKSKIEGAFLEPNELLLISKQCKLYLEKKRLTSKYRNLVPLIMEIVNNIFEPIDLMMNIEKSISEYGEISDTASEKLYKIRKEGRGLINQITAILDAFIKDKRNASLLQEPLILDRDGRFVVLIKGERKKDVAGIIHSASSSGAAYYCELISTVALNNKLKINKEKEKQVCREILLNLTSQVRKVRKYLYQNQKIIAELDMLHSLAVFAIENKGKTGIINNDMNIELKNLYHPLLVLKSLKDRLTSVVPLNIEFKYPKRGLVITGPNMGGKTVALKNIGLAVLMAHCAIPILAEKASMPFLDALFADIGEKQDLMQNLSTFSSHITNIIDMLNYDKGRCLFIIDELGTGTDPSEGAPLAVSIIKNIMKKNGILITTTHHNAVKIFAEESPDLINASMDFDIDSLKPTFRIIPGLPGTSHAFEIASKLGMPAYVVEEAKSLRDKKDIDYNLMIEKLNDQLKDFQKQQNDWIKEKTALEKKLSESIELVSKEKELLLSEMKQMKNRFAIFIQKITKEWDNLYDELKKKRVDEAYQQAKDYVKKIEKEAKEILDSQILEKEESKSDLRINDYVKIKNINMVGRIIEIKEKEGNAIIDFGNYRMELSLKQLEKTKSLNLEKETYKIDESLLSFKGNKINLIGLTVDEAISELNRFIDRAVLNNIKEIKIIHGYSKIKASVLNYLKDNNFVKSWREADVYEGGSAATIVQLVGER